MTQKIKIREIPKLRKSAKDAPQCFGCGSQNRGGNLVLAHSNALELGRGANFKTPDYYSAILCEECHDLVDGRTGSLSKEEKRDMHRRAHERSLQYWFEEGIIA